MYDVSRKLIVLKTHDVDVLRRFYEAIGIAFVEERHGSGPIHFASPIAGTVLEIYPLPREQSADDTTRLGFVIPDVDKTVALLHSTGSRVQKAPQQTEWGYMAVVADPDGRSVELHQSTLAKS